jgi:hypothetical protein
MKDSNSSNFGFVFDTLDTIKAYWLPILGATSCLMIGSAVVLEMDFNNKAQAKQIQTWLTEAQTRTDKKCGKGYTALMNGGMVVLNDIANLSYVELDRSAEATGCTLAKIGEVINYPVNKGWVNREDGGYFVYSITATQPIVVEAHGSFFYLPKGQTNEFTDYRLTRELNPINSFSKAKNK